MNMHVDMWNGACHGIEKGGHGGGLNKQNGKEK
jgi:hypothetical protein